MPRYSGFAGGLARGLSSGIPLGLKMRKQRDDSEIANAKRMNDANANRAKMEQQRKDFAIKNGQYIASLNKASQNAKDLKGVNNADKLKHKHAINMGEDVPDRLDYVNIKVPTQDGTSFKTIAVRSDVADMYNDPATKGNYKMNSTSTGLMAQMNRNVTPENKEDWQEIPDQFDSGKRFADKDTTVDAFTRFYGAWQTEKGNEGKSITDARADWLQKQGTASGGGALTNPSTFKGWKDEDVVLALDNYKNVNPDKWTPALQKFYNTKSGKVSKFAGQSAEFNKQIANRRAVEAIKTAKSIIKGDKIDYTAVSNLDSDSRTSSQLDFTRSDAYNKVIKDKHGKFSDTVSRVRNVSKLQDAINDLNQKFDIGALESIQKSLGKVGIINASKEDLEKIGIQSEVQIEALMLMGSLMKGALSDKDLEVFNKNVLGESFATQEKFLLAQIKGVKSSLTRQALEGGSSLVKSGMIGDVLDNLMEIKDSEYIDKHSKLPSFSSFRKIPKYAELSAEKQTEKYNKIRDNYKSELIGKNRGTKKKQGQIPTFEQVNSRKGKKKLTQAQYDKVVKSMSKGN